MDYKFRLKMYQDQAGDENAKVNIFVNGVQVVTEQEITATSADSPQSVVVEATGLSAPNSDGSVTAEIKVQLANDYYVDASTDRNANITQISYTHKYPGASWQYSDATVLGEGYYRLSSDRPAIITDWDTAELLLDAPHVDYNLITSITGEDWTPGASISDANEFPITTNSGMTFTLGLTKDIANDID
jgi:hypothetical protein